PLSPDCPHTPTQDTKYDWELLDYYELLGLKTTPHKGKGRRKQKQQDTSPINTKDVRKAYRKQAQLWHPDKLFNTTLSTEEGNARFARIAQAYEILSDAEKREEYDRFLQYCESLSADHNGDQHARAKSLRQKFSSVWENIRDPFRVFDDLFSQDDDEFVDNFDPNNPFSFIHFNEEEQQDLYQRQENHYYPPPQDDPVRTFQDKENLYDPVTGEGVLRISQTEEYASHDKFTGRFYYRIVAQDFKKRYDPYTTGLTYIPLTDPYLQEEGYRYRSSGATTATSSSSPVLESLLHSWDVMTPESKLLHSPNHRFVAGLSPDDCELLIMVDNPSFRQHHGHLYGEDDVYWSSSRSKTAAPFNSRGGATGYGNCFAILKGPHLIVAKGDPQGYGNRIMWYSDSGSEEEENGSSSSSRHSYFEFEDERGFWHRRPRSFLAQLDNDGSVAVYSVWSVPVDPDQTVVSKALMSAKDLYHGRVQAQTEYGHLYYQPPSRSSSSSSTHHIIYKRCLYSTSPVGCFRLGRRITQFSLEFYFRIKGIISKMNYVADSWLDLIYEEDDLFYSIKESFLKNGHAFGSKVASSSARFVRKVLEYFIHEERSRGM
ncbi:MAG: hypothetical protein SGILL_003852, partial [Bacillariaceae sp.]